MTDIADDLTTSWDYPDDDDVPAEPVTHPEVLRCPEADCTFSTVSERGLKRHITSQHRNAPDGPPDGPPEPAGEPEAAEVPPRPSRPSGGLVGRLRDRWRKSARASASPATKKTTKARIVRGPRVSIAEDLAAAYRDIGGRLEYSMHYPAGRMLTLQAPGAGVILDQAIAGSLIDRAVVQPIWRTKDRWEDPFYLLAPPLLLVGIQSNRARFQGLIEEGRIAEARQLEARIKFGAETLEWVLRRSMVRLAPAMAEARARREEEDAMLREAFPELGPGIDPVKELVSQLFATPSYMEAPDVGHDEQPADDGYAGSPG